MVTPFQPTKKLDTHLNQAGGLKDTAAIHRLLLFRPSLQKTIAFDLEQQTPAFQDSDILFVPPMRCIVFGEVANSGQVTLKGGETLKDILQAVSLKGQLDKARVYRRSDVEAGNERWETYDLSQPEAVPKVTIADGDVIYVPPLSRESNEPLFNGQSPLCR